MLLKELSSLASPLNQQQIEQLQQIVAKLSSGQLAWVSGYFWGLSQPSGETSTTAQLPAKSVVSKAQLKLTILYASQTGNAKEVSKVLEAKAKADGFCVSLQWCEDYKLRNLANETHLIFITSTHGEGDPPDDALSLHEFLQSKKAPKLDKLHYAVLGLGDSSYEFFCQAAKDFDGFFSKLGAKPMFSRLDCDVDYLSQTQDWVDDVLGKLKDLFIRRSRTSTGESLVDDPAFDGLENDLDDVFDDVLDDVVVPLHAATTVNAVSVYNKKNPFSATVLTNQKITGQDSAKDVRHIEICLSNSGLTYQPGDALGLYYLNSPELVDEILAAVSLTGDETLDIDDICLSLRQALIEKFDITASYPKQVADFATLSGSKTLLKRIENKEKLRQYANKVQLVDLLSEKKTQLSAMELIGLLRKLAPRLYSISSSQGDVGDEVHLTVALVAFQHADKTRLGAASGFVAERAQQTGSVRVYVEQNTHFKLPENDNAALIMIGAGTGVAPFRAFMQERELRGATGKNWLFFGDRTFTQDFLYQIEWQRFLKDGLLTHLDLAFSRDQKEKVYVQHRIIEQAKELWQWLQNGAHIYICGDANNMAKAVHEALISVIAQEGAKSTKEAEIYLNGLRKMKRYQKDVY